MSSSSLSPKRSAELPSPMCRSLMKKMRSPRERRRVRFTLISAAQRPQRDFTESYVGTRGPKATCCADSARPEAQTPQEIAVVLLDTQRALAQAEVLDARD